MSCRDEVSSEYTAEALRLETDLHHLGQIWIIRRHVYTLSWNQATRNFQAEVKKMKRRVRAWKKSIDALKETIKELGQAWVKDHDSVTPEHWDHIMEGKERKLRWIYRHAHPEAQWPEGVPYLNLIALANKMEANKAELAAERRRNISYAMAMKLYQKGMDTKHALEGYLERNPGCDQRNDPIYSMLKEERRAFLKSQEDQQLELLEKSRKDATSVSFEEWEVALAGTPVLKENVQISGYFELARRRMEGQPCDGFAHGLYFGPLIDPDDMSEENQKRFWDSMGLHPDDSEEEDPEEFEQEEEWEEWWRLSELMEPEEWEEFRELMESGALGRWRPEAEEADEAEEEAEIEEPEQPPKKKRKTQE
jgi:hypothetical protein